MRRIFIVLAGAGLFSIAAVSSANAQGSQQSASLSVNANVQKNCTIATAPLSFGAYDPVAANATAPLDGTGTVTVACTKGAVSKVGLGVGNNAQGATRRMGAGATDYLTYELYQDSAHAIPWGDTASTALDVGAAPNRNPRDFPVYGRVAAAQDAAVGSYTDTVLATVNF